MRAAERKAKENRLRIWKDWQSTAPQITGKEKEFSGTVVEVINGDALMVKLTNGQIKKVFLSSIRPPKEAGRYVYFVSCFFAIWKIHAFLKPHKSFYSFCDKKEC